MKFKWRILQGKDVEYDASKQLELTAELLEYYVIMADLTENYQLKWHSYSSHLHSCVASALSTESFADVSLFTMDGHHIMAHRFVLSACSQYLHHVLKFQQKVTTTLPLVIVLPPEINYKTIKTLIHYMYSGETTVSKDILESVLKGGDILKVKGLWRPKEDKHIERSLLKVPDQKNHITKAVVQNTSNNNLNKNEETRSSKLIELERSESNSSSQVESITDKESKSKKHNANEDKEPNEKSNSEENMQFLVIKDEPIEWSELEEEEMEMLEDSSMFNTEMDIKPEIVFDESEESTKTEELYSPLTCELCSETFSLPADWVRHIQTHTDMLPAKRQRRGRSNDEDTGSFPPLHCDMCQKYYATPAEWVRHIQSSHTEFELRVSNKTIPTRPVRVNRQVNSTHKMCTMCNKKFPSHASMLIHKRTHTGEKPYMCEHCQKGFNVKSNLLRHLRTLHDRIINSTDIEYRNDEPKNSNTLNIDT
ncbi:hypothetical protein FQR65_LT05877 [Abscondita terminalis]|nr:hypothetical protein FQR65_LT05877 [Abscondita terminalis]